ncbi:putative deacetylase LmbE-like domain-containing protein [Aspergillus granulosus]|uniref:N-acetylglucosaminylphosphatidylinositol deacetylase n=1 Tax=Aspergillus granulosus TaxID=176169 RepID=A0ABR4H3J7_9EURO
MKLSTFLTGIALLTPVFADNTLNIVAHPDDDLLFINPDILHDIANGFNVRTVYLTSGDAGNSSPFWTSRQSGALAAYAQMAGVESVWDESDIGVQGKHIPLYTLRGNPHVSLAFMHIPDGSMDGNGFPATGQESLEKLWNGDIARIRTVDESGTTYSKEELIVTLTQIIDDYAADSVNSLDYLHDYGTGDHSDHTSVGIFTNTAAIRSQFPGYVIAYRGYPIENEPVNIYGEDLAKKKQAFYTYAGFDETVCESDLACQGTEYELWLPRLYTSN